MGTRDQRIDAYIAKSAEFAQPILAHLREIVHAGCPDVEETIKWGHPHFTYHGMLCGMSSFKAHCGFGFWKASLIVDKKLLASTEAMGSFGRITSIKDLPSKKVLTDYVKQAAKLNEQGVTVPKPAKKAAKSAKVTVPDELMAALKKNKKALAAFEAFSPSHRREYADWVAEAKREETKRKRVATTVEWIAEGKSRNWKYENC